MSQNTMSDFSSPLFINKCIPAVQASGDGEGKPNIEQSK
jgi:hypothetical protein